MPFNGIPKGTPKNRRVEIITTNSKKPVFDEKRVENYKWLFIDGNNFDAVASIIFGRYDRINRRPVR